MLTRLNWLLGWVLGFRHGVDLGLAVVLCWAYLRSHKNVRKRIKEFFEDYEKRHRDIQAQIGDKRLTFSQKNLYINERQNLTLILNLHVYLRATFAATPTMNISHNSVWSTTRLHTENFSWRWLAMELRSGIYWWECVQGAGLSLDVHNTA